MRQCQVHGCFRRFRTGHFVIESRQRLCRHDLGQHLSKVIAQRVIVVKPEAAMRRINSFDDLGVRVADRIRGPAILEIDIAIAIKVPDEIALCPIDYDLVRRSEAPSPCFLEFGFELETVSKQRDTALQRLACLWTRKLFCHCPSSIVVAILQSASLLHKAAQRLLL
jgi:hypothetical protein